MGNAPDDPRLCAERQLERRISWIVRRAPDPAGRTAVLVDPRNLRDDDGASTLSLQDRVNVALTDVGLRCVDNRKIPTAERVAHRVAAHLHHRHPGKFGVLKINISRDQNRQLLFDHLDCREVFHGCTRASADASVRKTAHGHASSSTVSGMMLLSRPFSSNTVARYCSMA